MKYWIPTNLYKRLTEKSQRHFTAQIWAYDYLQILCLILIIKMASHLIDNINSFNF